MAEHDKERAKQILLEIIRQAGGVFDNKTNLYKAFYHAHLRFADEQPGYLSAWPIVRMPRGPGIDRFDMLLGELMAEAKVETKEINHGEYTGFRFALRESETERGDLPDGASEAIEYGVSQVRGKRTDQVSRESHEMSRAWQKAEDGEELNIYLDSLGDDEYREYTAQAESIGRQIDAVFGGR
jgi:hypothetical protein